MIKTALFRNTEGELAINLNTWLQKHDGIELVDIKYSTILSKSSIGRFLDTMVDSALIIYKEVKN